MEEEIPTLYVGDKPIMSYVMVLLTEKGNEMRILSRGRYMSKAIDVLEVFKRRSGKDVEAKLRTGTVQLEGKNISELIIDVAWD